MVVGTKPAITELGSSLIGTTITALGSSGVWEHNRAFHLTLVFERYDAARDQQLRAVVPFFDRTHIWAVPPNGLETVSDADEVQLQHCTCQGMTLAHQLTGTGESFVRNVV